MHGDRHERVVGVDDHTMRVRGRSSADLSSSSNRIQIQGQQGQQSYQHQSSLAHSRTSSSVTPSQPQTHPSHQPRTSTPHHQHHYSGYADDFDDDGMDATLYIDEARPPVRTVAGQHSHHRHASNRSNPQEFVAPIHAGAEGKNTSIAVNGEEGEEWEDSVESFQRSPSSHHRAPSQSPAAGHARAGANGYDDDEDEDAAFRGVRSAAPVMTLDSAEEERRLDRLKAKAARRANGEWEEGGPGDESVNDRTADSLTKTPSRPVSNHHEEPAGWVDPNVQLPPANQQRKKKPSASSSSSSAAAAAGADATTSTSSRHKHQHSGGHHQHHHHQHQHHQPREQQQYHHQQHEQDMTPLEHQMQRQRLEEQAEREEQEREQHAAASEAATAASSSYAASAYPDEATAAAAASYPSSSHGVDMGSGAAAPASSASSAPTADNIASSSPHHDPDAEEDDADIDPASAERERQYQQQLALQAEQMQLLQIRMSRGELSQDEQRAAAMRQKRPPLILDWSNLDVNSFFNSALPRGGWLHCRLIRKSPSSSSSSGSGGGGAGGRLASLLSSNKTRYELWTESNQGGLFLVSAIKTSKTKPNYQFVSLQDATTEVKKSSQHYAGKVSATMTRSDYIVYDAGFNPTKSGDMSFSQRAREQIAQISYKPHLSGKTPRKLAVLLPVLLKDSHRDAFVSKEYPNEFLSRSQAYAHLWKSMQECKRHARSPRAWLCVLNKPPRYHADTGQYVLDFCGRAPQVSVKNHQLVYPEEPDEVLFQLGRMDEDSFSVDFRFPLAPIQAAAIALSSLDYKWTVD